MKKLTFLAISFILCHAVAQGTLQLSNLGQTSAGSDQVASDAWVAGSFYTGSNPNGYLLNSVQLLMAAAVGDPNGFTISIYSGANNAVGTPISSLGNLVGADPLTAGVYTYSTFGIYLLADTAYDVVVTDNTPSANGSFAWSGANYFTDVNDPWGFGLYYFTSANGTSWSAGRGGDFQMALYATPVPEQTTWALAGIGAVVLGLRGRK